MKTQEYKIYFRNKIISEIENFEDKKILETHGGFGKIYEILYSNNSGAVIECDYHKYKFLREQRDSKKWEVYHSKAETILPEIGDGFDIIDVDPYGGSVLTLLSLPAMLKPVRVIAFDSGMFMLYGNKRYRLKNKTLREISCKYGSRLRANYERIIFEVLSTKFEVLNFTSARTRGYDNPKSRDKYLHYTCILTTKQKK